MANYTPTLEQLRQRIVDLAQGLAAATTPQEALPLVRHIRDMCRKMEARIESPHIVMLATLCLHRLEPWKDKERAFLLFIIDSYTKDPATVLSEKQDRWFRDLISRLDPHEEAEPAQADDPA